jgi:hypothetical protein
VKSAPIPAAHPLTVDEIASRYPDLKIIMAHMGRPWTVDAVVAAQFGRDNGIETVGHGASGREATTGTTSARKVAPARSTLLRVTAAPVTKPDCRTGDGADTADR